jgi:hypothetical protein
MAIANWHMMLAQVESMPEENWQALLDGRERSFPEWEEGASLLRQAAEGFQAGAASFAEALQAAAGDLERGYINADIKTLQAIARQVGEMADMMEGGKVPPIEQVHRIEELLREQHMAMDRKTVAIGALDRMRAGT